ncbi:PTS sugar transporter subunit IIA [Ligilactobacillus salivarius]|uniref:PTS sugar transporter subunit IIA n=1 Tax=Ligilactobacillus salivarius TaxID=1624 RepID=UPI0026719012|nr:PTS glucose transporter subunit IIA [Ligilactobacillus salivarius]
MGLFTKNIEMYAPVDGEMKPISESNDELFASKAMGDGLVITPMSNNIYSPIKGTIKSVFPTKHAIGIEHRGIEFLLHLGINTVELNGEGFSILVSEGDKVTPETKLGTVDFDFIKSKGMSDDVVLVCTNLDNRHLEIIEGKVYHSQKIGLVK